MNKLLILLLLFSMNTYAGRRDANEMIPDSLQKVLGGLKSIYRGSCVINTLSVPCEILQSHTAHKMYMIVFQGNNSTGEAIPYSVNLYSTKDLSVEELWRDTSNDI